MSTKKMFLKIKRTKKEKSIAVHIQWDEKSPSGGYETKTLDCEEPARPEFHEALNELTPQVPVLIEVPEEWGEEWGEEGLKVNGLTYKYDEYGHRSVGIIAVKELEGLGSPLVLNVPAVYAPGGDVYGATPLGALVDRLEQEAELYLARNRAQLELGFGGDAAVEACRELNDSLKESGSTMTITSGDRTVTLGNVAAPAEGEPDGEA